MLVGAYSVVMVMNQHKQVLADLLENNPKAQKMQFMIDKRLRRCNTPMDRLIIVHEMMVGSVLMLRNALNDGLAAECEVIKIKKEKEK